jgi:hypothetical protein
MTPNHNFEERRRETPRGDDGDAIQNGSHDSIFSFFYILNNIRLRKSSALALMADTDQFGTDCHDSYASL